MHDHWAAYQQLTQCEQAFCNAYHLRERQRAIDKEQAVWAEKMTTLFLDRKEQVDHANTVGQTALLPDQIPYFQPQYYGIGELALPPYLMTPPATEVPDSFMFFLLFRQEPFEKPD